MTTKHTPGPWIMQREHSNSLFEFSVIGTEVDGSNLILNQGSGCSAEANARLIAAAPKLYEALRTLYLETADYIKRNNLGDVHHNRSMQMASDALKKATGLPTAL